MGRKARLGVDAWGSCDGRARHILDPIEETFRREFPGFDPFPFGQQSWIHGLVRHILLAEPLVDEFCRCFDGVTGEAIIALADPFRFPSGLNHRPVGRVRPGARLGATRSLTARGPPEEYCADGRARDTGSRLRAMVTSWLGGS